MRPDIPFNSHNGEEEAHREIEALSPRLAQLRKPRVPMPAAGYFETLADKTIEANRPAVQPKRIFRLIPMGVASMAVAASIALVIIFWPTMPSNAPASFALNTLTDDELVQLALLDDDLLEDRMMEDGALMEKLDASDAFQYLDPADAADEEYNKLLLELIDDETLTEDW